MQKRMTFGHFLMFLEDKSFFVKREDVCSMVSLGAGGLGFVARVGQSGHSIATTAMFLRTIKPDSHLQTTE